MTRYWLGWTLVGLALAAGSNGAEAQARRRIAVGETKTARLTPEDWAQIWQLTVSGRTERTVTIELSSEEFDGYLSIRGPGLDRALSDDDAGPACDARLVRGLMAGTYTLLVTPASSSGLGSGDYRLSVREGEQGAPQDESDDCTWEDRDAPWTRTDARRVPSVQLGAEATGELTLRDSLYRSAPYRLYAFSPRANTPVTIDLSGQFDALLRVAGGGLRVPLRNDDGGPGCDARIVHTFPGTGPYLIQVTAIVEPMTGPYTLRVREGEQALEESDQCGSAEEEGGHEHEGPPGTPADPNTLPRIEVGRAVDGRLSSTDSIYHDDTYYQLYALRPRANTTLTVDLHSTDFDAYLVVRGGDLEDEITDDDNGPGCDSRIVHTFRGEGPYVILVNTVGRATGAFTLRVTQGSTPAEPGGCEQ